MLAVRDIEDLTSSLEAKSSLAAAVVVEKEEGRSGKLAEGQISPGEHCNGKTHSGRSTAPKAVVSLRLGSFTVMILAVEELEFTIRHRGVC